MACSLAAPLRVASEGMCQGQEWNQLIGKGRKPACEVIFKSHDMSEMSLHLASEMKANAEQNRKQLHERRKPLTKYKLANLAIHVCNNIRNKLKAQMSDAPHTAAMFLPTTIKGAAKLKIEKYYCCDRGAPMPIWRIRKETNSYRNQWVCGDVRSNTEMRVLRRYTATKQCGEPKKAHEH